MKISFVIPAYNEEAALGPCLESVLHEVARAIGDTQCPQFAAEVLVVNNASTDNTRQVAERYPGVKVVDEPHKGLVRARQAGYMHSTGDIIANIDADTRVPAGWLTTVLRSFERSPKLAALSGPYRYIDVSAANRQLVKVFYALGYIFYWVAHYVLGAGAMLQGGNYCVRRSALDAIGGFDTQIEFYGEDTDVAKRLGRIGEVRWTWALPMDTLGRRLNEEGVFKMGYRYAANFMWVNFFSKPLTHEYKDIRPK